MVLLLGLAAMGCGSDRTGQQTAASKTSPIPGKLGDHSGGMEGEARAILKAALDSWAFGDSVEKFEKDHPGVKFFDTSRSIDRMIGKYDIGTVRRDGQTFEFLVTLTFRAEGGDVNKSGSYVVVKDGTTWTIMGGAN